MADLQQPGPVDLLKMLTNATGITNTATTATDADAISQGFDPSSPDIMKAIGAAITKIKAGGEIAPDEAKTLGAAFKTHLDYNANMSILKQLNQAYTSKYGVGNTK